MLFEALQHVSRGISMHVPGHKNNTIGDLNVISSNLDLTEVPGLDNLHEPEAVLKRLNRRLGALYNRYAQLIVNGSTTGMLAGVHALNSKTNTFFMIGDAHKSLYNALSLFKKTPVQYKKESLKRGDVIVITSPTYFGDVLDVESIITHAKAIGAYIIVDEAHGAHFGVTKNVPTSLALTDADIVIQSFHKMLPSLTGASVVFIKKKAIYDDVMHYINIFETSSPNYLVMLSVERALDFYNTYNDTAFFKKRMHLIHQLEMNEFLVETPDDPMKLIINKKGYSPYDLEKSFRDHMIYSEMVTSRGVLWCLPMWHKNDTYPYDALLNKISQLKIIESEAVNKDISILDGKRAVETITPYPPGVPLILKGDIINSKQLKEFVEKNVKIEGLQRNLDYYNNEG